MKKRKVMFELDPQLLDDLKAAAEREDRTQVSFVARALRAAIGVQAPTAPPPPAAPPAAPIRAPVAPLTGTFSDLIGVRFGGSEPMYTMQGVCRALNVGRDSILVEVDVDEDVVWEDGVEWITHKVLLEACALARDGKKADAVRAWASEATTA